MKGSHYYKHFAALRLLIDRLTRRLIYFATKSLTSLFLGMGRSPQIGIDHVSTPE